MASQPWLLAEAGERFGNVSPTGILGVTFYMLRFTFHGLRETTLADFLNILQSFDLKLFEFFPDLHDDSLVFLDACQFLPLRILHEADALCKPGGHDIKP